MAQTKNFLKKINSPLKWTQRQFIAYWRKNWWHKVVAVAVVLAVVCGSTMYGIALWYQHEQKNKPTTLGVTFIADYANYLGLDAHQTYMAILNDLHVKHLRLVSYWSDIEPTPGQYNFSELDWEVQQAQAHNAKISLAIGLRQPRWPECHPPGWIDTSKPEATWEPALKQYIAAVVSRYKSNPALQSYQLENEYFNSFGGCNNFDRARLSSELALVKKLDPQHPVIISRSNNYAGLATRQPLPDIIGISVYRHVWNSVLWHRYVTYPFPSWYYAFLAGAEQIVTGKPAVIHELQTEPWPPDDLDIPHISLREQNKTFTAQTLADTTKFGKQTGIKDIDLWGAEYWYYRMVTLHDPSVWNTAEQIFTDNN